jgi:hypothetical protein
LTAEQFTGMAAVAKSVGEDQREFIESLVTLGKVASEGAAGKGEVATAWFKSLNLDAKQFKALRLDEQFFTVFEAIQKIQDPAERVRALMVAFGEDGGKYLLPLLSKSGTEIRAMAGSFATSTAEVEKATQANKALTEAGNVLTRGWRTIVIALAPVFEQVGKAITAMAPAFEVVGEALGTWFELMGEVNTEVRGWLAGIIQEIGQWARELFGLGEITLTVKDVVVFAFRIMGTAAALVWDTIKAGAGVVAVVFGEVLKVIAAVSQGLIELAKAVPDDLRPAWVDDLISGAERANEAIYKTGRGISDWGKKAIGGFGDSAVKFNTWLDGIANKQKEKAKEAAAEAVAAAGQVEAALKKFDNAALVRGSSAEVSARLKFDFAGKTAQDRLLAEQQKANKLLGDINGGVKKLDKKPVEIGAI